MTTKQRPRRARSASVHVAQPSPSLQFCIEFVLDETGSMSRVQRQTVAGFNEFLSEQQAQEGDCRLSLSKFESGSIRCPVQGMDIGLVPPMSLKTFRPGGGTNLFDAIGDRIEALEDRLSSWAVKPQVFFVVMTDGGDSMSTFFNSDMIFRMVTQKRDSGWTFAYLGADRNALQIGRNLGFRDSEITCFEQANIENVFRDLSAATTVHRASVTAGSYSTQSASVSR